MIKKLTIAALMLSLLPLAGCGTSDPYEQVTEDSLACMEEMVDVLATVKDKASAEAAKPKLEAVGERMKEIEKRMEELGKPDKAKQEALEKKYKERMTEIAGKMMQESMRVMMNPELGQIIGDAMKNMEPPK